MMVDCVRSNSSEKQFYQQSQQVYKHTLPWQVYSLDISKRLNFPIQIAIGSLIEDVRNYIKIVNFTEFDEYSTVFTIEHQFSPTKIM